LQLPNAAQMQKTRRSGFSVGHLRASHAGNLISSSPFSSAKENSANFNTTAQLNTSILASSIVIIAITAFYQINSNRYCQRRKENPPKRVFSVAFILAFALSKKGV
jgi:hypothetical protein